VKPATAHKRVSGREQKTLRINSGAFFFSGIYPSSFILHPSILYPVSLQKYWNRIYRIAVLAVFGLALTGVIFAFLPKVTQFRNYQETKTALEEDIRSKNESIKELRMKQERFNTDKYFVQQLAHEIGYAHEGETIYQFNERNASNMPPETVHE
jgi:hypothetical protein